MEFVDQSAVKISSILAPKMKALDVKALLGECAPKMETNSSITHVAMVVVAADLWGLIIEISSWFTPSGQSSRSFHTLKPHNLGLSGKAG